MSSPGIDALEIQALSRIMEELDYYQILNVEPGATTSDIRKAFHNSSRTFHPDANRDLTGDLREQCRQISKRVTEAYCVLRDARRRKSYDARPDQDSNLRIQLAEAKNAHTEQVMGERRGRTPQGRQFHAKAEADIKQGNLAGAIQNVQMALTFEANNPGLGSLLEELRARHKRSA